jgi:hypothetical protein
MRSKIPSIGVALITAAILVCGRSSLGEAKGDDCRAKPDGTSPAGLHWYYRVDRANNRHCWYLHQQGMPVRSLSHAASRSSDVVPHSSDAVSRSADAVSRSSDIENDTASGQVWPTPPAVPQPGYARSETSAERSETSAEQPTAAFVARWVDMPRSVDLNAHQFAAEGHGYAAEHAAENGQDQLLPTLTNVSDANGELQQNSGTQTHFGSIGLAGAMVLALLLVSEALVRFTRRSAWSLLRFNLRVDSRRHTEHSEPALDAAQYDPSAPMAVEAEPISRTETGVNDLRRLLRRADAGLRPPQSFAPSRSVHRHEHADRARAHSTFARLRSRSFSGMTWAPL